MQNLPPVYSIKSFLWIESDLSLEVEASAINFQGDSQEIFIASTTGQVVMFSLKSFTQISWVFEANVNGRILNAIIYNDNCQLFDMLHSVNAF